MENKIKIYTQITPEVPMLYHYTSQIGILGLINNKKLWFTNIYYMNDSTEYSYSLKVIKETLHRLYGIGKDLSMFFPNRYAIEPIFSFSLSEKGDSLSQWRGYCPNGGYSISFFDFDNQDQVNLMMKTHNMYIGKCVYNPGIIDEFVKEVIVELSPENFVIEREAALRQGSLGKWLGQCYTKILSNTMKYAPLIKHPSFEEEQEWRMVANYYVNSLIIPTRANISENYTFKPYHIHIPAEDLDLKFRPGKNFLIPYLEFQISNDETPIFISEMIVGPTPNSALAVLACKALIKDKKERVLSSSIPYRNW
ncbi:DUF2971 domain-containing protein [Adhaeribacter swui]|uniref:DUF2971 domain-containing protein n=1 Tax=Adhaeribacter swui TaxID=2086471 RepID=A0A7G7GDM4_9BACT|nr:DUF2971 domain-containing protein [Adhaeribacter swui]QNF35258.1 DUF2971 domain-containing protein [Adhaeribacter swui]